MSRYVQISLGLHVAAFLWLWLGDVFETDPPEMTVADVTVISAEEFAALSAPAPSESDVLEPALEPEPAPEPVPDAPALAPGPLLGPTRPHCLRCDREKRPPKAEQQPKPTKLLGHPRQNLRFAPGPLTHFPLSPPYF